jgi:hypothetical protein
MLALLNAKRIHLGRSLFHWGLKDFVISAFRLPAILSAEAGPLLGGKAKEEALATAGVFPLSPARHLWRKMISRKE